LVSKYFKRYDFQMLGGPLDGLHTAFESDKGDPYYGIPSDLLPDDLTEDELIALLPRLPSITDASKILYDYRNNQVNDVIEIKGNKYLITDRTSFDSPPDECNDLTVLVTCVYQR
jgi:hypothetical protein